MPPQQSAMPPASPSPISQKPPHMNIYVAICLVLLLVLLAFGGGAYYGQMNPWQTPAPVDTTQAIDQNAQAQSAAVNPVDAANPFNDTTDTSATVNVDASASAPTSNDYQNPFQ